MITARSISEQLSAFQLQLDVAAVSVISGGGGERAPPSTLPLSVTGAFPPATWHAPLPSTGLDASLLAEWSGEGLAPEARKRIDNVLSVYSLGFHQLVRSVRAGMEQPSSTIANIWKIFVFLLNDCMPDGSVYAMRIAAMEREQSARARELIAQREAELARLMALERELQTTVRQLDSTLRHIQAHRQQAEDSRLEALDSIDEQELLQAATAVEIRELEEQAHQWQLRFDLANNRHRMVAEDLRHYQRMQNDLQTEQYQHMNEYAAAEQEEIKLKNQFEWLNHAFDTLQEKQRRMKLRHDETEKSCERSTTDNQELNASLAQLSARINNLTALERRKVKERNLVVKQVEKIQQELNKVLAVEHTASSGVESLSNDKAALVASIASMVSSHAKISQQIFSLRADITRARDSQTRRQAQIEDERTKLEEIQQNTNKRLVVKLKAEKDLASLQGLLDSDDGNIATAERQLAAAMAAVQALTDTIRTTKGENRSLLSEVRVLDSHREQLGHDIITLSENIESHQPNVQQRLNDLATDVTHYEGFIVKSAEQSKELQEEAVRLKQAQLDFAAEISFADLDLERVAHGLVQQLITLSDVQEAARETAEKRVQLGEELEKTTEVRNAGRAALDQLHQDHDARMLELQNQLDEIERKTKEKQQLTTHAKQNMHALSVHRHKLESDHDGDLVAMALESKSLDIDDTTRMAAHAEWLAQQQTDQQALQAKLKAMHDQVRMTRLETKELENTLATTVARRQAEQDKAKQVEQELAQDKQANSVQSTLVSELSAEVALAAHQHAEHMHDNQTIHHLLEYTLLTNAELERRQRTYADEARQRTVTATQHAQTEGEWQPTVP